MMTTYEIPLSVGESYTFSKTISETDVYMFSGITEDFSQMHFNEQFMKKTQYGTRIAQGVLIFALSCTASTRLQEQVQYDRMKQGLKTPPSASYGYDRIRFVKPVFFGDTVTITETAARLEPETMKVYLDVKAVNQRDEVVLVATHILKFLPVED